MKKKPIIELSLAPYPGRVFIVLTRAAYEKKHKSLFGCEDKLNSFQMGRFTGHRPDGGVWTYLVWAKDQSSLVHELSHVVLEVFDSAGIDPRGCGGEPFCYMLSHLLDSCNSY